MGNCVFCKIAKREISTKIEIETENLVVFKDINPKAPIHLLIVPKKHLVGISEVDEKTWFEIKDMALKLAADQKLSGFRLVSNNGDAALINHMHVHFLGQISVAREV